jgi:hypothetical protein
MAHRVVLGYQLCGQSAGAFARPAQRRLRVAARQRLYKLLQSSRQIGIAHLKGRPPAA